MVAKPRSLAGRTLYVPRMCLGGSRAAAAAFRSLGVDARLCPEADDEARAEALRLTVGDECYPQRVTLAEFCMALREPGFAPERAAFLMPAATGPCRFGQYAVLLERILARIGAGEVMVVSPNCDAGYRDVSEHARSLPRLLWWGVVGADLLRRTLHRVRPYETTAGAADRAHAAGLDDLCAELARPGAADRARRARVRAALVRGRDRFRAVPVRRDEERLLVGVVGEIFCRLNTFANDEVIRALEALGAEAWLSGLGEWVWYVNAWERHELRRTGRTLSGAMLAGWVSERVQRGDEGFLSAPFAADLRGREEPHGADPVLALARPYLPYEGALGEMVLSVGKAAYLQRHGAHGVLDVSPFSCMNGVVSEAVYPAVSRDHGGIPIRNLYFDGSGTRAEDELEIFLDLAASYRARQRGSAGAQVGAGGDLR